MNPEFDQDDVNIEDFLYTCFNKKNKNLKVTLDAYKIFNQTLISVFNYYFYFETAYSNGDFGDLPASTSPANNTAFIAMQGLYFTVPIFSDAKSCEELGRILQQNLGLLQAYFSSLPGVNNKGVLDAEPILQKLQTDLYESTIVLETICQDILKIE